MEVFVVPSIVMSSKEEVETGFVGILPYLIVCFNYFTKLLL